MIWYNTSCSNFEYEMTSMYYIYSSVMTEVNVSATVEMSANSP